MLARTASEGGTELALGATCSGTMAVSWTTYGSNLHGQVYELRGDIEQLAEQIGQLRKLKSLAVLNVGFRRGRTSYRRARQSTDGARR